MASVAACQRQASNSPPACDGRGQNDCRGMPCGPARMRSSSATPVGPVISRFCLRAIQSPSTSLAKKARSMQTAACAVDILDDGRLTQRGELQARDEALIVALRDLAVDHEARAGLRRRA